MKNLSFALLLVTIAAGTLALAGGTRSYTDVKGLIFATGAVLICFAAFTAAILGRRRPLLAGRDTVFPLAALGYLLFIALSFLWARHPWAVRYVLARRATFLILAVSAGLITAGGAHRKVMAGAYAFLGVAAAVFSLIWHGLVAKSLSDIRVPLGNPNLLGAFLLLPIAATGALALSCRRERRFVRTVLLTAALVPQFGVFVLCRSLSAWIGLALCVAVMLFLSVRKRVLVAAGMCGAVLAALLVLHYSGALEGFRQTRTYLERREWWRRAVVMVADKPLIGRGAGSYFTSNQPLGMQSAEREVVFREGGPARRVPLHVVVGAHHPVSPHNEYLDNAAEMGVVGLILYCVLVSVPLIVTLGARRDAGRERLLLDAFIAVYAAWLVTNSATQNMYFADFAPHFWILAGMLAASGLRASQDSPYGHARSLTARRVAIGAAVLVACLGVWFLGIRPYLALRRYQQGCRAYSTEKDFPRARDLFRWAADNAGDERAHVWALDMLGYTYLAMGEKEDLQSAHAVFKDVNGKVEGYDHFGEGLSQERGGLYSQAVDAYEVHERMRPADKRTRQRLEFCRMMAALGEGKVDKAAAAGREYFVHYADDMSGRRVYFRALLETEPAPMAELARMAAELPDPPVNPLDKFLIGRFRLLCGDAESAITLLEEAHSRGYRGPGMNRWRTVALMALGRYEDAWEVLQTGRRGNPTCKYLIQLEKDLRELLGRTDDASPPGG